MLRIIVMVFLLVSLSSCVALIHSDITTFHELPNGYAGTAYAMVPFKEQEGSLEHKMYEQLIKAELNDNGFREVPIGEAEVVMFISYGIDTGKEVITPIPIFGQTGVSSGSTYGMYRGYGGYGTYSGTTTYTPTYGVVGAAPVSQTVYTRFFKLDVLDRKAFTEQQIKKLYEARVVSHGRNGQISEVLPTMIKALFEEFPGKSGSTRRSIRSVDE